ncbi:NAD(+) synthase, partial [Candidatus Woesearchaeota archaeon]|nr:NAD(+) synthase [Candidatus Woesearchaeota archaeon]
TKGWKPQMELVDYILPSGTNKSSDTKDGIKVAERLGIRYEVHNIEPVVKAYKKTNPEAFDSKFDKGNLTSRIRANILNTKAATERKILLGTGNKDEDYGIGYYTLFGDGAVHISPIGCLSKRQVKDMARYLGFADIARKTPTAGLEPRQTDFNDLGYDYDIVELVMEGLEQGFSPEDLKNHQQLKKAFRRQMKKSKFDLLEHVVEDIIKRHEKCALPKAKLVSPKMPKIYMARV